MASADDTGVLNGTVKADGSPIGQEPVIVIDRGQGGMDDRFFKEFDHQMDDAPDDSRNPMLAVGDQSGQGLTPSALISQFILAKNTGQSEMLLDHMQDEVTDAIPDAQARFVTEDHARVELLGTFAAKLTFGGQTRPGSLLAFLELLKFLSDCDSLTCYLPDVKTNRVNLAHTLGTIHYADSLSGLVKRYSPPMKLRFEPPQIIEDVALHPILTHSAFRKREKILSVIALPFAYGTTGRMAIVFLNYSSEAISASNPKYRLICEQVPRMLKDFKPREKKASIPLRLNNREYDDFLKNLMKNGWQGADSIRQLMKLVCEILDFPDPSRIYASWHTIDMDADSILLEAVYMSGQADDCIMADSQKQPLCGPFGVVSQVVRDEIYIKIDDVLEETEYRYLPMPVKGKKVWARSELAVPMRVLDERAISGVLNVESLDPNAFGPEHVEQLELIANEMAAAIDSHRQFVAKAQNKMKKEFVKSFTSFLNQLVPPNVSKKKGRKHDSPLKAFLKMALKLDDNVQLVDFYPWDHTRGCFDVHRGEQATRDGFNPGYNLEEDRSPLDPRTYGNSVRMIYGWEPSPMIIREKDLVRVASPGTVAMNIKSLIGVIVASPCDDHGQGILWVRMSDDFDFDANPEFERAVRTLARVVSLLWSPIVEASHGHQAEPRESILDAEDHVSVLRVNVERFLEHANHKVG